jgi:50S ribosomal protein L16 3-hydroxylase
LAYFNLIMKNLPLGELSLDTFLTEYWQKKPLLIRNALPGCQSPIAGDELAGLACEEGVESRLIIRDDLGERWELQHGPFSDETFLALPDTNWTLLVQAVDHWVPEAAKFLQLFNFIPSWRLDDLMISYASDGGGVGPHYDNYDVFLVQVGGRRQWEVGGLFDERSPRRSDTPVMILSDWEPEQRWILDPGDMLYVPPRVGHSGIAVGDGCMTCSVGFRAPSHKEILQEFSDFVSCQLSEEVRFADPDLVPQTNPGHMTSGALHTVHRILRRYVDDQDMLAEWFGHYMTVPKFQQEETQVEAYFLEDVQAYASAGRLLTRKEGSRFAFQEHERETWLFVDGRIYLCPEGQADLVKKLCVDLTIDPKPFTQSEGNLQLLVDLLNRGSLYLSD